MEIWILFIQKQLQMTLYRIKNIAEVATLCHYDIRLLSRTIVETEVLLGDKRVDGHINIDLDIEKLLKGG